MNVCAGRLTLHQVPSARDNLIWLLVCNETGDAAVVDGPEADSVLAYCERHQIKLTKVLNTHTHPDHIGLNLDLEKRGLLAELDVYGCPTERASIPGLSHQVDEGSTVAVGVVEGQVWRTEGHLDGHVSALSRERVRRARIVLDLIERYEPDLVMSEQGATDLGVPEL